MGDTRQGNGATSNRIKNKDALRNEKINPNEQELPGSAELTRLGVVNRNLIPSFSSNPHLFSKVVHIDNKNGPDVLL